MRMAMGILFMWLGAAGIYIATHGTQATTPYGVYQSLIGSIANA